MVEDRITDGKRIGQLLASELTGLERGPLGAVSVVDADPDVEPTDDGAFAYRIEAEGEPVGTVFVTVTTARLELDGQTALDPQRDDVTVENDGTVAVAHSGAAVKTLVDVVAEKLT
ncbi:hypothetical protein NDI56_08390 [Haloarcula sp. S1CR25-12]|uniref:DUF7993 domain-containing protein n=1 Tax=Haloarcula saliterrae TaxID=2950534 RepID=A0ABU2FAV2_9EURY|nr:hypothetical protein [Haloarcula sp. S1CR25-12]MDS0259408.1 hypothetical protein [Haloarcula sp. S1CR25-12]